LLALGLLLVTHDVDLETVYKEKELCFSLIQFFNKSKKWADMANMPPEFRVKIDRVERNFTVSMVVFKKYQPIFVDMFRNPVDDQLRQPRSRKQRLVPYNWIILLLKNMKVESLYNCHS